jgi:hypothetical protein
MSTRYEAEKAERKLVDAVMMRHRQLVAAGKIKFTVNYKMTKATWDDPSRFKSQDGKLSCIGSNINDVYATQKLANGEWHEQFQFAGPNWDTEFVPLDTCDLQCFDNDPDGTNPRLAKKDGSKISVADQLADAERIVGAALGEGVKIDLIGPDPDIKRKGQYKVVVTFNEVDDLNNDDIFTEQCTQVMSYSSGSGAKNIALLTGGFGTCIKLLDASYGSKTKVRPSRDVNGKRHEFNVRITPQVDASGKAVKITDSGKEDQASAERAVKKGLVPELPVGPRNCKKKSSTLFVIYPIEKLGPPPPVVDKSVLFMATDPLSLDKVYYYKRSDHRFVHVPTSTILVQAASAVAGPGYVTVHNILNYTPCRVPIMLSPVYKTVDPVNSLALYTRKWTDGSFRIVNLDLAQLAALSIATVGAPHCRGIQGYTAAVPTPDQLREHPDWAPRAGPCYRSLSAPASAVAEEGDDDAEQEPFTYCSMGVAASATLVASATAEAVAEAEEPVIVDVADAVPDVSNDAAIAAALNESASPAPEPPMVGDKRSISTAERVVEEPDMNMRLCRQSMCPESDGAAPMITQNIKVSFTNGVPVYTQFLSVCLKRGTGPTDADLIAIDALVGECKTEAIKASGVSGVKTLSGAYSESMGAASTAPMTLQEKCDVQATSDAVKVTAPVVGVLVGGLF